MPFGNASKSQYYSTGNIEPVLSRCVLYSSIQFKARLLYRNTVLNLIKAAKQKYFTSIIENDKGNTKIMWNCIRELTGNCSISNKVNMLIIEGEQI